MYAMIAITHSANMVFSVLIKKPASRETKKVMASELHVLLKVDLNISDLELILVYCLTKGQL